MKKWSRRTTFIGGTCSVLGHGERGSFCSSNVYSKAGRPLSSSFHLPKIPPLCESLNVCCCCCCCVATTTRSARKTILFHISVLKERFVAASSSSILCETMKMNRKNSPSTINNNQQSTINNQQSTINNQQTINNQSNLEESEFRTISRAFFFRPFL